MPIFERFTQYFYLMRLNKPIGILLLLWPALWALWLAGEGHPDRTILFVFVSGVVLTRSLGCVLNDIFDRRFDGRVKRTRDRVIASGKVTVKQACALAALLCGLAFLLVLTCNLFTIALAFIAAALMLFYPLMKRFTHLPQVGLGVAFSFSIPMAFAAQTHSLNVAVWFLFLTAVIWPVIYDTMYAMVDKSDDMKIGIKSTAILFAERDKFMIALLQVCFVIMLAIVGFLFHLHFIYYVSLSIAGLLFMYQQRLIKNRDPEACFKAFLNNNWVGLVIFAGILLSYWR